MIVFQFKSQIYRFDYIPPPTGANLSTTLLSEVFHGYDDDHWWIGIRWRINWMDSLDNEVLGYLSETRTAIERDKKSTDDDIKDIIKFLNDSFINVELAFQNKLRYPYNVFGKPKDRPDFELNAKTLSSQLVETGFYS